MSKTVVGLFPTNALAESAKQNLISAGYSAGAIQILTQDTASTSSAASGTEAADTGFGAKISNFFKSLAGAEEEQHQYAQSVKNGGAVLSVSVADMQENEVADLLEEYGARDVNESPMQAKTATAATGAPSSLASATAIPVVKEEMKVGKQRVDRGGVRVFSHLVETPVEESIKLREEHIRIDRQNVNRPATEADFAAFKEGAVEFTETAEEAVVSKSARVVEEISIGKEATERTQTIRDTVRHTEVEVTELGGNVAEQPNYDPEFRKHFQSEYASSGKAYDSYAPAYKYGQTLGNDPRYSSSDWATVEPAAQKDWATQGSGKWEDFKGAVQHGWGKIRNASKNS